MEESNNNYTEVPTQSSGEYISVSTQQTQAEQPLPTQYTYAAPYGRAPVSEPTHIAQRDIRRMATFIGIGLLSISVAQLIINGFISVAFSVLDVNPDIITSISSGEGVAFYAYYLIVYIAMFIPPIVICGYGAKGHHPFRLFAKKPAEPSRFSATKEDFAAYETKSNHYLGLKKHWFSDALMLLPVIYALAYTMSIATNYIKQVYSIVGLVEPELFDTDPTDMPSWVFYIITLCVVAPIVEEMVFRGAILRPLRKYGNGIAIACQALMFAMFHRSLSQLPYTLVGGLLFASLAVMYDGILPGIILHSFNNGVSLLLSLVLPKDGLLALVCSISVYAVAFGLGMFCIYRIAKRDKSAFKFERSVEQKGIISSKDAIATFIKSPATIVFAGFTVLDIILGMLPIVL